MKSLPTLEGGPWPTLCIKEVSCPKKLKRKPQEGPKRVNGYKSFRADLKVPEPRPRTGLLLPAERGGRGCGGGPGGGEILDMRKRCFPPGPGRGPAPSPPPLPAGLAAPPGSRERREAPQTFGEQSARSRIVLCPPPPRQSAPQPPPPPVPPPPPPPRPAGSSFSSISHVIYNNSPDSAAASPRKRPGESAGASSEIKAIQQTRRLLANARERTRVHTISAAFEALRKGVPCYSYGQKLSKLAILRIACNYILSLARLADLDYSADHSNMSFSECVEQCTRTLQAEGRSKKRKVGSV
uniref:Protein atonal homolog 8 n=1 Tax=Sarcophilus harrisii TaxID=9305 RepID=A0A7N4PUK2_SARHA